MDSNRKLSQYIVFYGFARLTKKARRKKSVIVQYANSDIYNDRQERYIKQQMNIIYKRFQTVEESQDAQFSNRSWTKFEYFIDDKKWKGDLEAILKNNFIAEENHVSLEERTAIMEKLKKQYYFNYMEPVKRKTNKDKQNDTR